jgi:hypothetical protein
MESDRASVLATGAAIVGEVLAPHGFCFTPGGDGIGSGGAAAWGSFDRGGQRLELHLRHSLGLVSYSWDGVTLTHREYLRGLGVTGAYPGFSQDPLDGFRHLAEDLAGPLHGFVVSDRQSFLDAAAIAESTPRPKLP